MQRVPDAGEDAPRGVDEEFVETGDPERRDEGVVKQRDRPDREQRGDDDRDGAVEIGVGPLGVDSGRRTTPLRPESHQQGGNG